MDIYLERLELHGFKSFPQKTVIKFHKGITAVIGPNGCGKSNIVDALLWVLGEQKIKNLRGENSEDLIFNGSETTKPLGMTEVSAGFVNHSEPLYVARRFFRTGESKYILNEKYCRHRDIQDVLFKLQLGGRGYFIFEQGSIEKMVSLKPAERRSLIEEAAGISQYLERKRETINKLIVSEQNLDNLEILTADKEKRLKELKNQVNYVERYREYKRESVEVLSELLFRKSEYSRKKYEDLSKLSEELLAQERVVTSELSVAEKKVVKFEEERWGSDLKLKEIQKEAFEINRQIMGLRNEKDKNRQFIEFADQKTETLKKRIENNKGEIHRLENKIADAKKQVDHEEELVKKDKGSIEVTEERLLDLKDRIDENGKKDLVFKSDIFTAQSELTSVRNRIRDVDRQMIRLENEEKNKRNLLEDIKKQLDETKEKALENEIADLRKLQSEEIKALDSNREAQREREGKRTTGREALNACRNEIDNLQRQEKKYCEIRDRIVGKKGKNSCGRPVQETIRGKKEFLKVLENFYFEEMEASVLKDSGAASECSDPRVLLPITEKVPDMEGITGEPGFVSFVKDLFELDTEQGSNFLRNGVLVKSLSEGVAIFNKYGVDIVTEDGIVLNSGGLITRNREKGILELNEEIRRVGDSVAEHRNEEKLLSEELKVIGDEIREAGKIIDELDNSRRLREKEILRLDAEFNALRRARESALKREEAAEKELILIEENKEKLQEIFEAEEIIEEEKDREYNRLVTEREEFATVLKNLKDEENRIEKEYLEVENSIRLRNERIRSSKERFNSIQGNIKRLEKEIVSAETEVAGIGKQEETKAEEILHIENRLKNLETRRSLVGKDTTASEEKLANLNEEIKKESADLNKRRTVLADLKDRKSRVDVDIASVRGDLNRLEEESFRELNRELKELERPEGEAYEEATVEELDKRNSFLSERLLKMRESNRMNFSAESEYELLAGDYEAMLQQKEDVIRSIQNLNDAVNRIDKESREKFSAAFASIKDNFVKNFEILFEGGEAELVLTDTDNPLESGLEIKAQPPGKKLQNLRLLSGGEKTLTSLAFLFALFEYKPSPFCVFDEVDASLDEANIQRFLKFLHKLKDKTQFLIITHNFKTMEEADYIYGISMNEPGISTVYSTKMVSGAPVINS